LGRNQLIGCAGRIGKRGADRRPGGANALCERDVRLADFLLRRKIGDFLADAAPGAYERVVDRLLASPRYGEHRARYWLDAVRYGDTNGEHADNLRTSWPYRDYVIKAFNENKRFDQFVTEQLAGDLLPPANVDQLVATQFNRLHTTTNEGGSVVERSLQSEGSHRPRRAFPG
jgi:hypothetical protein